MTVAGFLIVVLAAALHAGWNLVVKGSSDKLVSTWAVFLVGGLVGVGILAVQGLPDQSTVPWLTGLVAFNVLYPLALARSYEAVDLSIAYPISRGVAPVLVAVAGVVLLDDSLSVAGVVGLLSIVLGVIVLTRRLPERNELAWPLATGATIAVYTFFGGGGVRASGESLRFISAGFVLSTVALTLTVLAARGPAAMGRRIREAPWRTVAGGLASAGGYLLVTTAARTNPLGLVSGLRETSTAFGVIGAAVCLREDVSRTHVATVALMVVGAALIAVS